MKVAVAETEIADEIWKGELRMYSENSKNASMQRANNEFLRRMLGGELSVGSLPVFNSEVPALPEYPVRPPCNDGESAENGSIGEMEEHCGGCANMPSLAMVYAPKQCWRKVFKPEDALMHGSQFAELVLPFDGAGKAKGGCPRC